MKTVNILVVCKNIHQFVRYVNQHMSILVHCGVKIKSYRSAMAGGGLFQMAVDDEMRNIRFIHGTKKGYLPIKGYHKDEVVIWIWGSQEAQEYVNHLFRTVHIYPYI